MLELWSDLPFLLELTIWQKILIKKTLNVILQELIF